VYSKLNWLAGLCLPLPLCHRQSGWSCVLSVLCNTDPPQVPVWSVESDRCDWLASSGAASSTCRLSNTSAPGHNNVVLTRCYTWNPPTALHEILFKVDPQLQCPTSTNLGWQATCIAYLCPQSCCPPDKPQYSACQLCCALVRTNILPTVTTPLPHGSEKAVEQSVSSTAWFTPPLVTLPNTQPPAPERLAPATNAGKQHRRLSHSTPQ
jgi:hypothetical protein